MYRVFTLEGHSAEVEEGTTPVHHRYKYEWTDDGVVRATAVGATVMSTDSIWELCVWPRERGGSHVDIHVGMSFKDSLLPWASLRCG
jgi:hypothetical protein